jgi:sugar lactone lactonase YvrE
MKTALSFLVGFGLARLALNCGLCIFLLGCLQTASAQTTNYTLGTTALLVGPASGTNSVVLGVTPNTSAWTATANTNWLHLSLANQSGTGSRNVIFSYDANAGGTRSSTLTIAGQTLTVTQAGSTYVAATAVTTLVSNGLNRPSGVAIDGEGDVYLVDCNNNAIKKWTVANNTVTTLVSSGLSSPVGLALDTAGNIYFADTDNNSIKEWKAANSNVVTLVSSGLEGAGCVAVDGSGNVYITDFGNNELKEWMPANSNVTSLVSVFSPTGVAVDAAGNVYVGDYSDGIIEELTPAHALTTLVSGANGADGVAVDGSGNVYVTDYAGTVIEKWTAASNGLGTLVSGLNQPVGVAVDGTGNVYIADTDNNAVKELPYGFVDPTPKFESAAASSDTLPTVLPITENLLPPFAPTSDQPWLTITGVTNGVVNFSFTVNTRSVRTAHIALLGQSIPIIQQDVTNYSLGTTAHLEGPTSGIDSIVLAVNLNSAAWTATANASWLHLSLSNQSGTGSRNVIFTYDANAGATRAGTLTIAGQTVTVTQAGSTYVAAGILTTIVSGDLYSPSGIAVDHAGNVYFTDLGNNIAKEWVVANDTEVTLVSSGLSDPQGLALDGTGNVYIADTFNSAIKEWTAANSNIITLISSELNNPMGVAVDSLDNLYIADTGDNAIKKWTAGENSVSSLVSGLNTPQGLAVDIAGNVYIADSRNNALKEWTAADSNVTSLVSSGLDGPVGVAVDGSGNVYACNYGDRTIKKWAAGTSVLNTLVSAGLKGPGGIAVDGNGNIYVTDTWNNVVKELPYAFVDPTPRSYSCAAGSDVLLVLPAAVNLSGPFTPIVTPSVAESWFNITGVTNGVVSFAFTTNSGPNRAATISLLGQSIPIFQASPPNFLNPTLLEDGALQLTFSNFQSSSFTVLSTTNLFLPVTNWTVVGSASNIGPDLFQFTDSAEATNSQRYYTVRSP